jgi:hypothetical protein
MSAITRSCSTVDAAANRTKRRHGNTGASPVAASDARCPHEQASDVVDRGPDVVFDAVIDERSEVLPRGRRVWAHVPPYDALDLGRARHAPEAAAQELFAKLDPSMLRPPR